MKKGILIIISILCLLLAVGAGTSQGLRWLIVAADRILPVEIRIDRATGSLLGPLSLEGVYYNDGAVALQVDSVALDWRPLALFGARVHIRQLQASGIDMRMLQPPQEKHREPTALPTLPFTVTLDEVRIEDIGVLAYAATDPVRIDQLLLGVQADDQALQLDTLSLDAETFALRMQGLLPLDAGNEGRITMNWWLQMPGMPRLTGSGALQGNIRQLQLEQDISGPAEIALRATAEDLIGEPGWKGTLDVDGFDLQLLQPQSPKRLLAAQLSAGGGLNEFSVEGKAQIIDAVYGMLEADLQFTRSPQGWQLHHLDLKNPKLEGNFQVTGELADSGAVTARAAWRELAWKLSGQQSLRSPTGELLLQGRLDAYRIRGNAQLESTGYPLLILDAEGSGTQQGFELASLRGSSQEGSFESSAAIAWAPQLQWNLQADVREFDPAFFIPDRSGRLSFRVQSEGGHGTQGLQGQVSLDRVAGTLQGQAVSGQASARFAAGGIDVETAQLAIGAARLSAAGRVDTSWDLQWEVTVPELGKLQSGAGGALQGRGGVTGPRDTPRIVATLAADGLRLSGLQVNALQAEIDLDLSDRLPSNIVAKGDGLMIGDQPVAGMALNAAGTVSSHEIVFSFSQEKRQLVGKVGAALDAATWTGSLNELSMQLSADRIWSLQRPAAFTAARTRGTLEPLCMVQENARLCAMGEWQADSWSASLDGMSLPLALLEPWLQPDLVLEGSVGLQVRARSGRDGLQAQAELALAPGSIAMHDGEEILPLAQFGQGHFNAQLLNNVLEAQLDLPLQEAGSIGGRLHLANVSSADGWFSAATTISSDIRVQFTDNGLISGLVPGISNTKGQVDANLAVRGTLANPLFDGTAALKNAEVLLSQPGIRLTDMNLQVSGDGNALSLQGSATSGEGVATLEGQMMLREGALSSMDLAIGGERVQLMNLPEATLFASPDLEIKLRGKRLDVSGTVRVPAADIRLRELKGVAKESDDLVLAQQDEVAQPVKKFQLYSRLTLVLEDKVAFSGFGLDGNIQGTLEILEDPGKATRGQGELNIIDGTYALYGTKLEIETGRLVFAGGPIGNPRLDMRVVRETGNVLAGVRVTGSAESPQLDLFSEPSMEQSNILSYLLLGVPTNQASGAQGAALTGAAASLGLTGGDLLARKLGNAFGIEDVRIESGDTLQDSSLVLGKYLSPSLYISYAVGLFDQSNIFRMRYTLSRRWSVQTEAGVASGADLLYSLEND